MIVIDDDDSEDIKLTDSGKKRKAYQKVDKLIIDLTDEREDYDVSYLTAQIQIILKSMNLPPLTQEAL